MNTSARWFSSVVLAAASLGVVPLARARCDDPALAASVRQQIATTCVCTQATNHGQYVRCVADQVNQAVATGLPTNCKGTVKRCAARSTCGKKTGFVTCCRAKPGTCNLGLCQDKTTACIDASTCPIVMKCSMKSTTERCVAAGGSPGSGSCCDAVCSLPPPAP